MLIDLIIVLVFIGVLTVVLVHREDAIYDWAKTKQNTKLEWRK